MNKPMRDKLSVGSDDPTRLRQAAFRCISVTQDDPATQIEGMAIALYATCQALDVDMRWLIESTERRCKDLDGAFVSTFRAIEEYARNEIGRLT